ncbi:MAG: hypothetical protein UZ09_BCD002002255 [Bacteroidetes bacterium OLB9]|nr:MAG: hypothetical protein UZ09_BCD002002255 [Bacteroidetes bacterium OLB9]
MGFPFGCYAKSGFKRSKTVKTMSVFINLILVAMVM